jgi:hypothetical protein
MIDIKTSSDSFAGAGAFMLAPFYFAAVAVLNVSLYALRKRNANSIYLAGLVVPILLFVLLSIH